MALIHILARLKKAIDIEVICAHVNHNTGRPGQLEEQQYVEKFCRLNNIIFETMTISELLKKILVGILLAIMIIPTFATLVIYLLAA